MCSSTAENQKQPYIIPYTVYLIILERQTSLCTGFCYSQHSYKVLRQPPNGSKLLFGLQLVRVDFLPRNNLKHLAHVWSAGWPACQELEPATRVSLGNNPIIWRNRKKNKNVTRLWQIKLKLWFMLENESVFPSSGCGPCGRDICCLMGETGMMSSWGDLLQWFWPMRELWGEEAPVRCAAVKQKRESWQESSRVFQQVSGSISISLWLTLGHAPTLINSILLTSLPPASPHHLFSIKEAKRSIGAEMRHLYIIPPCHQMCGDVPVTCSSACLTRYGAVKEPENKRD